MENHDNAVRAMMTLTTLIANNMGAAMRGSAEVCLEDAEACYDREDYASAIARSIKGGQYISGFAGKAEVTASLKAAA